MSYNLMLHLFVFMGSFLLFTMEPMIARIILPNFGGAFHVWSITMTFFKGHYFWDMHIATMSRKVSVSFIYFCFVSPDLDSASHYISNF